MLPIPTNRPAITALALGAILGLALFVQGCATHQEQPLGTAEEYAAYGTNPYEGQYYGVNPYAPFMFGFYDPFWFQRPYYYYPYPYVVRPRPYRPRYYPRVLPRHRPPRIRSAPAPRAPRIRSAPAPHMMRMEAPAFRWGGIHMGGGGHMGGGMHTGGGHR